MGISLTELWSLHSVRMKSMWCMAKHRKSPFYPVLPPPAHDFKKIKILTLDQMERKEVFDTCLVLICASNCFRLRI